MIDRAFQDRAEELGLQNLLRALADGLSGPEGFRAVELCSCGVPNYRSDPLRNHLVRVPHDRACQRIRFALMFASPATLEHMRNDAHETVMVAMAIDQLPNGQMFDDVMDARKLLGK